MLASQFGKQIKEQRARLGLVQSELAARARVSRTVLSRLESERGGPVQTDVLDRILASLGAEARISLGNEVEGARVEERLRQRLRQEELRHRHLRLALALCADPKAARPLADRARQQVALWKRHKSCSPTYIARWGKVLRLGPREMALAMTSFGEWENALYQNTPWSFAWT